MKERFTFKKMVIEGVIDACKQVPYYQSTEALAQVRRDMENQWINGIQYFCIAAQNYLKDVNYRLGLK